MKSMIKEALMKRKMKLMPKENKGMMIDKSGSEVMDDTPDGLDVEIDNDDEPGALTVEVEGEDEEADKEKDLAPGKPSNPEDEKAAKDQAHSELIDAIMGGLSKEEIMEKRGKLSLGDRIKQGAAKQKA